jgi:hypothetical protein
VTAGIAFRRSRFQTSRLYVYFYSTRPDLPGANKGPPHLRGGRALFCNEGYQSACRLGHRFDLCLSAMELR